MTFEEKLELMKQYLLMKFEDEDWHGVMDAAADIRELIARNCRECKDKK